MDFAHLYLLCFFIIGPVIVTIGIWRQRKKQIEEADRRERQVQNER